MRNKKADQGMFKIPRWWYFLIILVVIILFQGFEKNYSFNGSYLSSATVWIGVMNVFYLKPATTIFLIVLWFTIFYILVVLTRILKIWCATPNKK